MGSIMALLMLIFLRSPTAWSLGKWHHCTAKALNKAFPWQLAVLCMYVVFPFVPNMVSIACCSHFAYFSQLCHASVENHPSQDTLSLACCQVSVGTNQVSNSRDLLAVSCTEDKPMEDYWITLEIIQISENQLLPAGVLQAPLSTLQWHCNLRVLMDKFRQSPLNYLFKSIWSALPPFRLRRGGGAPSDCISAHPCFTSITMENVCIFCTLTLYNLKDWSALCLDFFWLNWLPLGVSIPFSEMDDREHSKKWQGLLLCCLHKQFCAYYLAKGAVSFIECDISLYAHISVCCEILLSLLALCNKWYPFGLLQQYALVFLLLFCLAVLYLLMDCHLMEDST